jgi:HAD superfamily hydrolase (TIGR01458 family)
MSAPAAVVLDMEGVLHVDWQPLAGAAAAVTALASAGIAVGLLTNTTGRTRADIARRLAGMGIELPAQRVVTAASATADHLRARHAGARVYVLGEPGSRPELAGVDLVDVPEAADVVVLGGPGPGWDYPLLNRVFRALRRGAPLVAMQRNAWWPTADGPALDAGMFVAGLEYAAGVQAHVVGKPSAAIYRSACEMLGAEPRGAMMVGDDLWSDLAPARALGMRTCLVRTGKGTSFDAVEGEVDLDLADLAALPRALGLAPTA